jgi:hypothetical protein
MELLSNIRYCYNGNAFVVVHVSADFREAFYRHAAAKGIRLFADQIFWNDIEISTIWGNTLPSVVWNYLYLKSTLRLSFSHFQIISPSNMIIMKDLDAYIKAYDVVMRLPVPTDKWMWNQQTQADARYLSFRKENGLGDALCTRVDGLAVRDEIFGTFVRKLLLKYSIADMQDLEPAYPQEETILPTYLTKLKDFAYRFGPAMAKTYEPHEPALDEATVERLMAEQKIAYLKRIPPQEDNPLRRLIMRTRSFGR